jgi:hypothetical protein
MSHDFLTRDSRCRTFSEPDGRAGLPPGRDLVEPKKVETGRLANTRPI